MLRHEPLVGGATTMNQGNLVTMLADPERPVRPEDTMDKLFYTAKNIQKLKQAVAFIFIVPTKGLGDL